jgi:hypothetical protein
LYKTNVWRKNGGGCLFGEKVRFNRIKNKIVRSQCSEIDHSRQCTYVHTHVNFYSINYSLGNLYTNSVVKSLSNKFEKIGDFETM